jgi:hypothetical protein
MKAILEFDLPDERTEFALASASGELSALIFDLDNELRNAIKYGSCAAMPDLKPEAAEIVRKWLREEIQERNIPEEV